MDARLPGVTALKSGMLTVIPQIFQLNSFMLSLQHGL